MLSNQSFSFMFSLQATAAVIAKLKWSSSPGGYIVTGYVGDVANVVWAHLELERAQIFRARVGLGLWVADSGRARACQILASSPSGFGNICFSLLLRSTRRSISRNISNSAQSGQIGLLKKPAGFCSKLSPGFSGFRLMYCGLSIEPGPTGSGLGPFQL